MSGNDTPKRDYIFFALDEVVRRLSRAAQRSAPTFGDEECGGFLTPKGIRIQEGQFGAELELWINELARELAREQFSWLGGELYCGEELIEVKVRVDFERVLHSVVGIRVGDVIDRKCQHDLEALGKVLRKKLAIDHLHRHVNWRIKECVSDLKFRTRWVSDSLSRLCEFSTDSLDSDTWKPLKRDDQREETIRQDFGCCLIVESVILDACEHQLNECRTPNSVTPVLQRLVEGIRRMQSDTYELREWIEDRAFDAIIDWWGQRWKPVFESLTALLSDVCKTLPDDSCLDRDPPDEAVLAVDNTARNAGAVASVALKASAEQILESHGTPLDVATLRTLPRMERYEVLRSERQRTMAPKIDAVLEELIDHFQNCAPGHELDCGDLLTRLKTFAEHARLPVPIAIDSDNGLVGFKFNYPYGEESENWLIGAWPGYLSEFYGDVLDSDGMRKWTSEDRASIVNSLRQWQRAVRRLQQRSTNAVEHPKTAALLQACPLDELNAHLSNAPSIAIRSETGDRKVKLPPGGEVTRHELVVHANQWITLRDERRRLRKGEYKCLLELAKIGGSTVVREQFAGYKRADRIFKRFRDKFPGVVETQNGPGGGTYIAVTFIVDTDAS